MSDSPTSNHFPTQAAVWILVIIALYVLSIGPAYAVSVRIWGYHFDDAPFFNHFYRPILFAAENSSPLSQALDWYDLWWENLIVT